MIRVNETCSWWYLPLLLALSVSVGCGRSGRPADPHERGSGTADGQVERSVHGSGESEAATQIGASDLDRSLDELMAARCEHGVATHACSECRYEIGMVEVADEMLDPHQGALRTVRVATGGGAAQAKEMVGEVGLDETRAVFVAPPLAGVVRAIHVDVGRRVRAGQVLFEIDSAELAEASAAHRRAVAAETLATATAARERDLFARNVCPRKDVEEAEAAAEQARAERTAAAARLAALGVREGDDLAARGRLSVRAPFDGEVLERSLALGALVSPGERAMLLADTREVWVATTLHEREVAAVLDAQGERPVRADVDVPAYPGRTFSGVVTAIGGRLDETTRTATARVVVPNGAGLLRAGMFARVRLLEAPRGACLLLPAEAVLEDEGRRFVFVRVRDRLFARRPVEAVARNGSTVEVTKGLAGGEEVVTAGAFLLKSDVLRAKMGAGCAD